MQQQNGQFLPSPGEDEDVWGALIGCDPSMRWTAAAGTKLQWQETGTVAGVVVREATLPREAKAIDGKVCFAAAGLSVCIEDSQLQRQASDCPQGLDAAANSGFGGTWVPVPRVEQGKPRVSDGLDRDILRRIVRAHINDVRHCYNVGLAKNPKLAGRVTVAFEIGPTGKVSSSAVEQDTIAPADEDVGPCIAKAVQRWTFPKPKGVSRVEVVVPFELESTARR